MAVTELSHIPSLQGQKINETSGDQCSRNSEYSDYFVVVTNNTVATVTVSGSVFCWMEKVNSNTLCFFSAQQ